MEDRDLGFPHHLLSRLNVSGDDGRRAFSIRLKQFAEKEGRINDTFDELDGAGEKLEVDRIRVVLRVLFGECGDGG